MPKKKATILIHYKDGRPVKRVRVDADAVNYIVKKKYSYTKNPDFKRVEVKYD